MDETITIERRYSGPPNSANGGYTCGLLAAYVSGPAIVTLRKPPPLERPLTVATDDGRARLLDGDTLVAEASAASVELEAPEPVTFDEADTAGRSYRGFQRHGFPTCFVCGPKRDEGDGLRIFPGNTRGGEIVAATWVPDASLAAEDGALRPEFVWAALDCPSGWAFLGQAVEGQPIVLGSLAAKLMAPVRAGERLVAMGWRLGEEGRKRYAGSAVYSAEGELKALGRATWVRVQPGAFARA